MRWMWHWGERSNERAVANARAATADLCRSRVEREETELFLRRRYAGPEAVGAVAGARSAAATR